METDHGGDEHTHKKGRHRKKLLYNQILKQMEFYFSDSNLSKDRMLSQLTQEDPFVEVSIFLRFNKIRKLTTNIEDITKALSKSDLIELSEDKTKIRRKDPVKVNENVEECTIYVERLKSDATHEWLKSTFSEFGNVVYVSMPRYKHNDMIKGFAFVEFEKEEEAKAALEYFESIDCKISQHIEPDKLCSTTSYEIYKKNYARYGMEENVDELNINSKKGEVKKEIKKEKHSGSGEEETKSSGSKTSKLQENEDVPKIKNEKKRKISEVTEENANDDVIVKTKKIKVEKEAESSNEIKKETNTDSDAKISDPKIEEITEKTNNGMQVDPTSGNESEEKKKKKKKSNKKKLKDLGLQILSKNEWKKMRNRYLEMQRKTMKQLKRHLNNEKFSSRYDYHHKTSTEKEQGSKENRDELQRKMQTEEQGENNDATTTSQFTPGIIVKISLPEPCFDNKKFKNEIKACSPDIKYVDLPLPTGNEEVYVRFTNPELAKKFCASHFKDKTCILKGDEEKDYWKKIEASRIEKQNRAAVKQRGRSKLLKKAEKQAAKHIRFDDSE